MKHFTAALLIILMLFVPLQSIAESGPLDSDILPYDLTVLSTDTLQLLHDLVRDQLIARLGSNPCIDDPTSDPDSIGDGEYIVGVDIKSGTYDYICISADGDPEENLYYGNLCIRADASEDAEELHSVNFIAPGEMFTFTLTDGMYIEIHRALGHLVPSEHSWRP